MHIKKDEEEKKSTCFPTPNKLTLQWHRNIKTRQLKLRTCSLVWLILMFMILFEHLRLEGKRNFLSGFMNMTMNSVDCKDLCSTSLEEKSTFVVWYSRGWCNHVNIKQNLKRFNIPWNLCHVDSKLRLVWGEARYSSSTVSRVR